MASAHTGAHVPKIAVTSEPGAKPQDIRYRVKITSTKEGEQGQPLTGLKVQLSPQMAQHGHKLAPVSLKEAGQPGEYQGVVQYPMNGEWEVTVEILSPIQAKATVQEQVGAGVGVYPLPALDGPRRIDVVGEPVHQGKNERRSGMPVTENEAPLFDAKRTELIRRRYNRLAPYFDAMEACMGGGRMDRWRERIWALAARPGAGPEALEVGVGTGKNMPFYPPGVRVTGIDFSPAMLERAQRRLARLRASGQLRADDVELRLMDAQRMEFPDASFDTVVATCVYCSVPNPVLGLREMGRVCKPDGKILLLEHMRTERPVLGMLMDWLNPVTVGLTGVNINRRTMDNIAAAGLHVERVDYLMSDIVRLIVARPGH